MGDDIKNQGYHYVEWYPWDNETKQKGDELKAVELYDHQMDKIETRNIADVPEMKEVAQRLSLQLWKGWKGALPPTP